WLLGGLLGRLLHLRHLVWSVGASRRRGSPGPSCSAGCGEFPARASALRWGLERDGGEMSAAALHGGAAAPRGADLLGTARPCRRTGGPTRRGSPRGAVAASATGARRTVATRADRGCVQPHLRHPVPRVPFHLPRLGAGRLPKRGSGLAASGGR